MTPSFDDPAQRDLAWVGYHPRAAALSVTIALVATVLVLSGRWSVNGLSELADRAGAWAVFALAWAVWPGLVVVFLYRTVTLTYRLTDRAVLVDFGFLADPVSPIKLNEITLILTGGDWILQALGVGWVEVHTKDRSVRLSGVRFPEAFAQKIRSAMSTEDSCFRSNAV